MVATATNVVVIDFLKKRAEIKSRYESTIKIFEHQYKANLVMLLSEYNVKCHSARILRDSDLKALEENGGEKDNLVWVPVT